MGEVDSMKEWKRELKKQLVMRWDEILTLFVLQMIVFLFGQLVAAAAVYIFKGSLIEIGTLLSLTGAAIVLFCCGIGATGTYFNVGISMCAVRKRLVPAMYLVTFAEAFLAACTGYFFYRLELWIFDTFYPGVKCEMDFGFLFQWKYILAASLALTAGYSLIGALFVRFGKVASWIFWMAWVVGCAGLPRSGQILERHRDTAVAQALFAVGGAFGKITESALLWGIAGASALMLIVSYLMLRRQQVQL